MSNMFRDVDLEERHIIFDKDYGVGLKYKDNDGTEFISALHDEDDRGVTLRVTSYAGISAGAQHYYGRLVNFGLPAKVLKNPTRNSWTRVGKIVSISGYGDVCKPKEMLGLDIELTRAVTKKDLPILNRGELHASWKIGDRTTGFFTQADVIERGREIFKKHFKGWKLKIDRWD
jgi:hypothetical protein